MRDPPPFVPPFSPPTLLVLLSCALLALLLKLKKSTSGTAGAPSLLAPPASLSSEDTTSTDRPRCRQPTAMDEDQEPILTDAANAAALSRAKGLVPTALEKARSAAGFPARWRAVIAKLERVPPCLSDLSGHPCFAKNALCRELLHSVSATLAEAADLADRCGPGGPPVGKLQMQSDLDALAGRLDLNLRDCALLVKTGVLGGDAALPSAAARSTVRELLARLQIGHAEAKHRAVEGLLDAMREDERGVLAAIGRTNVSALVQLLAAATPPRTREKAAAVVCCLAESGGCENLLISEGVLPPLIRLAESGTATGREKAAVSLQRLSMSAETARSIVGHGGVRPLVEMCGAGDSVSQSAAAGALKNLSAVAEVRQALAEEGVVKAMIGLLDCGIVLGSKEYAAECLQNMTSINESLRRRVVAEGAVGSLLAYLDGPLPQEPAAAALRNLVGLVPVDGLLSLGLLPRMAHVLNDGSPGAQQAMANAICKIAGSAEVRRLVGEHGCVPPLVRLLEAKTNGAREAAAQAIAGLMGCPQNCREVKRAERGVASLVALLDPSLQNTAKKHAVACLAALSASRRCRKEMTACGAAGRLRRLAEMDVPGARKVAERLERGKLRSLFSRRQ